MSRRRVAVPGTLLVAALALAGCAGGAADSDTVRFQMKPPRNAADIDKIKDHLAEFTEQTGIAVELDVIPSQETQRTPLQTQLQSGDGPDLFTYDTGPAYAGVLAEAGLLYDLTDAYEERGWDVYEWAKPSITFDGSLYGVPDEAEEYGVFYNKDIFAELGLEPPATTDDLRSIAAATKDAGYIPFAFGNKEGFEATHQFSMILSSAIGGEGVQALIDGERSWTEPEVVDALDLFAGEFQREGYLPDSVNAIDFDGQNTIFYAGEAAMLPTATVLLSSFKDAADFEVGFFPYPNDEGTGVLTAALGGGFFVGAQSRNPEGALELLDFLTSEEHRQWQAENLVTVPAGEFDISAIDVDPLLMDALQSTLDAHQAGTTLGISIELNSSDEFNKVLFDGLQQLLSGDTDAQQLAAALEQASE